MLLVPSSFIATDIRTGFPNLISNERLVIEQLVGSRFVDFNQRNGSTMKRPLLYADSYLQTIEDDLFAYFNEHQSMDLVSCNIQLFTDIMSLNQTQVHSTNSDDQHDSTK